MKKWIFIVILSLIVSIQLFSQPKSRILGVVMGISKYQNVPSLRYADRDAMSFYNFLLSPAGGGADTNNIRLLLNEKATSYNFFEAMDNLLDMAKEGDQVYIYFAGHGDIEKKTERQNGFLIGSNAPANCYAAGGCISVRFLQDYVETLVSKNKSKVTLIIDACRSGKLAGGSQGNEITALALQAEWKGVTKILSCQPGETSLEGEQWGGGAGVFTYFMLKGMLGQADKDGDEKVSVMELNNYLDENVLKETNKKQLPTIIGDRRQDIVKVDKKHALALLNQMEKPISLPPEKQSAGFEADISKINDISVLKEYEKFKYYINNNNLIAYNDADKDKENALSIFRSLESNRAAQPVITMMKGELLAALLNKAQIVMNGWINGNYPDSNFHYAYKDLKTAYSLVDSSSSQYTQIKYKYYFWNSIKANDTTEKIKLLEECIKTNPDEPFAYLNLGSYLNQMGQYDNSILNYNKAIELSINWVWAWSGKGFVLEKLGKYEEAIKCYDRAIEINPQNYDSWINKGSTLNNLGKNEEAIKCYDKAIDINPQNYKSWINKGFTLNQLGRPEEALKCLDRAIEIKPNNENAWSTKFSSLILLGRYNEALKCVEKEFEINPNGEDTWFNKGLLLYYAGKYDESLQSFNKVLEINPKKEKAWLNKGAIFHNTGRFEEAIKCFDTVLEIIPNDVNTLISRGYALEKLKKYDEAIVNFEKAIKINPNLFLPWSQKGYINAIQKKYEDAIKNYNKVLELKPDDEQSIFNMACIFSQLKNKTEMLKFLKKAIELNPKKYKVDAPKDEDLKEYWNDPDFLELVK